MNDETNENRTDEMPGTPFDGGRRPARLATPEEEAVIRAQLAKLQKDDEQ